MPGLRTGASIAVALILAASKAQPQDYVITTVAGGGPASGPALNANLGFLTALGADPSGNCYVATSTRVFKVDLAGQLSVAAGHGGASTEGDGGPAFDAGLGGLAGLAVDHLGNFYVSQYNVVRRVDGTTGLITRFAGNGIGAYAGDGLPATAASLNAPSSLAVDSAGNVFILDDHATRIRRVAAGTGLISTVAGNGLAGYSGDGASALLASFDHPVALVTDATGNLFVADTDNNRVRRVDHLTGVVTTFAGSGSATPGGDGGPATSAGLSPHGLAFDSTGALFIADQGRIRRVDGVSGFISTPGLGPSLLGLAFDGSTGLFGLGLGVFRVRTDTGAATAFAGLGTGNGDGGAATNAGLLSPVGVAVDAAGNVFVADVIAPSCCGLVGPPRNIRKVAAGTGAISTLVDDARGVDAIAVDPRGNLFLGLRGDDHAVYKMDPVSGARTLVAGGSALPGFCGDGGPAVDACLESAAGLAVDPAGNLFIGDRGNGRVRRVDAVTGVITTVAGDGNGALSLPEGLAVDRAGDVYIADPGYCRVFRRDAASGSLAVVAGNGTCGFSGDGGPAVDASLARPSGLALDTLGNLFIADSLVWSQLSSLPAPHESHRVRRVDKATGKISTVAGTGAPSFGGDGGLASAAGLHSASALAIDRSGALLVADTENLRVRRAVPVAGLSVADAAVVEGNSGTSDLSFLVSVVAPGEVRVDYTTTSDTAQAGADFAPVSGELVFPPGTFSKTVVVAVKGDTDVEENERFFLDLSNPTNAVLEKGRGVGTILDDDRRLDFYPVSPCRAVDTRGGEGPRGGPALVGGLARSFVLTGSCSIPVTARAVSLNVTVTSPTREGDLRLLPGGTPGVLTSVVNYGPSQTRAQNAVATLGPAGDLSVQVDQAAGLVHVIIDVNGYFQ